MAGGGPMSNRREINPFLIPGHERQPLRPLRPWAYPEHANYYVPVDGHNQAFDHFLTQVPRSSHLMTDGFFVLVTGAKGCGKSALLHRSVHLLSNNIRDEADQVAIIDLTADRNLTPAQLCGRLLDEVKHAQLLNSSGLGELDRLTQQPERFYPYLARALPDDLVLLLLLPRQDNEDELLRYAHLVRGRLCFFAELTTAEPPTLDVQAPHVVLHTGNLKGGDVMQFVVDRMSRWKPDHVRHMTAEAIDVLARGSVRTIAQLQQTMVAFYEDRLRHDDERVDITGEDVREYLARTDALPPDETTVAPPAPRTDSPRVVMPNATEGDTRWDFFLSYTQADRQWAEWVAWQLEEAGYRVLVQAWDFIPGTNWQAGMQQGVSRSDRTVALISPAYLQSVYGQQEWQAAQSSDPLGFARKLVPVRIADCERPGLLAAVVSFDLFQFRDKTAAREHLLDQIRILRDGRAKPVVAPEFPNQER